MVFCSLTVTQCYVMWFNLNGKLKEYDELCPQKVIKKKMTSLRWKLKKSNYILLHY